MNSHVVATLIGIVFQVGGAAYLVWQARATSSKLAQYKASGITWNNFALVIEDLAHEIHDQFKLQLRGFVALAFGSALQLYGVLPA